MKRTLVLLTLIFAIAGPALAQELKYGFIDDQRILSELPAVQEVQKILDKESLIWEKQFSNREQILKNCLDSLTAASGELLKARQAVAQSGTVADTVAGVDTVALNLRLKRLEDRAELAKKELVAYYRKIYGDNGVLKRRNAELSQSVLERLNQVIREQGEKLGYTLIFDNSLLLYVNQDYNITTQVMEALNIQKDERAR